MKQATLLLLVMLLASQAFGQKKKNKKDATDAVADTIAQGMAIDTVSAAAAHQLAIYQTMYDTLRTKVFKYAFDPARMSVLIDSLSMQRASSFAGLNATSASLMDSVSVLHGRNAELRAHVDEMIAEQASHTERTVVINELKQWKALLDEMVITQDEYNAQKKKLLDAL